MAEETIEEIISNYSEEFAIYNNIERFVEFRGYKVKYGDYTEAEKNVKFITDKTAFLRKLTTQKHITVVASSYLGAAPPSKLSHSGAKPPNERNEKKDIYVVILKNLEKNTIQDSFINVLKKYPKDCHIIFIMNDIPQQSRDKISHAVSAEIEFVLYKHLLHVWPDHVSMAPFEIVREDEHLDFSNINIDRLPSVLTSYPMVVWSGAKPGDIIKIRDINETSNFQYRRVVERVITKL